MAPRGCLIMLFTLAVTTPALGKGFLKEPSSALRGLDASGLERELKEAMGEALGCGGQVGAEELASIERELAPIWRSLPKNAQGRAERRSLRYLVHRYFDRQSALHVRGFEPSRPANGSGWGDADILSQRVPAYVESVLEAKHKLAQGFDLRDAAYMVATLQQLIFDSESIVLEKIYHDQGKPLSRSLSFQGLGQVLESYLVHWLVGDDAASISILLSNRSLLQASIPHWTELVAMADGQVKKLEYTRQHEPRAALAASSARHGNNALSPRYAFEDVHHVVGGITTSFASYWESECQSMKGALVEMDTHRTGRVPLSKFYSSALDSEWRFGESETYLRELGALDETSWLGKQVIIPNYIQAASNCIVSTPHYLVCCMNECEGLQGELEVAVGGPLAEPGHLLALVGTMSSQTSLDDDFPPPLGASLEAQLHKIAETHGGRVLLHGRLFAQWLHYAFPRECPFPHKAGVSALTPAEYGERSLARDWEMRRHAETANASQLPAHAGREELQWMSQWSPEEELIAEHAVVGGLHAPWEAAAGGLATGGGCATLLLLAALLGLARAGRKVGEAQLLPVSQKAHVV